MERAGERSTVDGEVALARTPRRDRTRANDEAILDAALQRIGERGVDGLSMREVATSAGLTSGAMYARYENAAELSVAVWEQRCQGELLVLLADALTLIERDDPTLRASVAARLACPTPALRAAIEILVVARRMDELAELAEVAMPAMLAEFGRRGLGRDTDAEGRALRLGLSASILGGLLHAIVPGLPPVDWDLVLAWHAVDLGSIEPPTGEPTVAEVGAVVADTGDPLRDRIIQAVGTVVARSGFERATISRVARRAGCGIAAIYDRYPNRSELVADAARVLLRSLDRTSSARYPVFALGAYDAAAAVLASNVSPANANRRRLRLEIHVAAAHDPHMAEALVDAERAAVEAAVAQFAEQGLPPSDAVRTWIDAARIGSRGMQLAAELIPDLGDVDFRWLTRPLMDAGLRQLFGGALPRT